MEENVPTSPSLAADVLHHHEQAMQPNPALPKIRTHGAHKMMDTIIGAQTTFYISNIVS